MEGTAWNPSDPLVSFQTEERKGDQAINTWGIAQQLPSPFVYGRSRQVRETKTALTEREQRMVQLELLRQSSLWYLDMARMQQLNSFWKPYASLFEQLHTQADLYFSEGAIDVLQYSRIRQLAAKLEAQFQNDLIKMESQKLKGRQFLENVPEQWPEIEQVSLPSDLESSRSSSPEIQFIDKGIELRQKEQELARARMLPGLYGFGGLQSVNGARGFVNVQVGLTLPVWNKAEKNAREQARLKEEILQREKEFVLHQQEIARSELVLRYHNLRKLKRYFNSRNDNSTDVTRVVQIQMQQGSLDLAETLLYVHEAYQFTAEYLNLIYQIKETELQWMVLNDQFGDQQ
jgi:hypothetical protein